MSSNASDSAKRPQRRAKAAALEALEKSEAAARRRPRRTAPRARAGARERAKAAAIEALEASEAPAPDRAEGTRRAPARRAKAAALEAIEAGEAAAPPGAGGRAGRGGTGRTGPPADPPATDRAAPTDTARRWTPRRDPAAGAEGRRRPNHRAARAPAIPDAATEEARRLAAAPTAAALREAYAREQAARARRRPPAPAPSPAAAALQALDAMDTAPPAPPPAAIPATAIPAAALPALEQLKTDAPPPQIRVGGPLRLDVRLDEEGRPRFVPQFDNTDKPPPDLFAPRPPSAIACGKMRGRRSIDEDGPRLSAHEDGHEVAGHAGRLAVCRGEGACCWRCL